MVFGLIELYEATFNIKHLYAAIAMNERLISEYWDHRNGGFYFTPASRDDVLVRMKSSSDGAIPSGNSVAVLNLVKLAKFTDNRDLMKKAEEAIQAFSGEISLSPDFHSFFLIAIDFFLGPAYEVVVAGKTGSRDTEEMLATLRLEFIPNKVLVFKPSSESGEGISKISKFTDKLTAIDGKATAYVCRNFQCSLPTTDPASMLELFK
jgi:hypothetical protein